MLAFTVPTSISATDLVLTTGNKFSVDFSSYDISKRYCCAKILPREYKYTICPGVT